ncbi:uncharacterized protein [Typha latifolia]|uniref:uncharacterized protein n=1 Tax=Typha latifolia TaxID=4733 RepID=UPI003C30075A
MGLRRCELCEAEASVYCEPDAAFLCWACDATVHGANFLVARHVRRVACGACRSVESGRRISGAGACAADPVRSVCRACDPDAEASSSSSSCVSAAESAAKAPAEGRRSCRRRSSGSRRRVAVDSKAEAILEMWSRRMGLHASRACAEAAMHVLGACDGELSCVPLRVALAGALWLAVKLRDGGGARARDAALLRRLEACSGVPGRIVVAAAGRIARARTGSDEAGEEEGWAESS